MPPRPILFRVSLGVLACAHVLAACQREHPTPPAPTVAKSEATVAPLAPPAVDRAELLKALDLAASASAAGKSVTEGDDVVNRRFVIRVAFGCNGPMSAEEPGRAGWKWGPDRRSIDFTLTPADWSEDPFFSGADSRWEAAEGFWIVRPWMRDSGCPADPGSVAVDVAEPDVAPQPVSPAPEPVAPMLDVERPVMGLAAVFEAGGSRLGRRDGKPFAFTLRDDEGASLPFPTHGYRLVIEGRLAAFPDGRAIRCHVRAYDVRPLCIAAAAFDRVAFEDAEGKLLREWRPG